MDNLTYEQAVTKLEENVLKLESGELSLDEAIKLYEESSSLSAYCSDLLNNAELKIKEFAGSGKGDNNEG